MSIEGIIPGMGLEEGVVLFDCGLLACGFIKGATCFLLGTLMGAVSILGCLCTELLTEPFFKKECPKNSSNSILSEALRFSSPINKSTSSCEVPDGILRDAKIYSGFLFIINKTYFGARFAFFS